VPPSVTAHALLFDATMAIVQALLAFVTRSLGRVLGGLFGWAVVAIFGHTSPREKLVLSGLLAAAGAWPVLVLGIAAPKLAVFVLSFVPLSDSVPAAAVRPIWIGLAVLVPLAVGMAMAVKQPGAATRPWPRRLLAGFPLTVALSAALLITVVTVPAVRLVTIVRRQQDVQVPLITDAATYPRVADRIVRTLARHGLPVRTLPAPWWLVAPLRILRALGGEALGDRVPARLAYLEGRGLMLALYPSALLIRAGERDLARAQGVVVEDLSDLPVWQTFDPRAQDVERQIARIWEVYRQRPADHRDAAALRSRVRDIAAEIETRLPIEYDEWQVVYRKALQLRSALHGERPLLEESTKPEEEEAMATHEHLHPHAPRPTGAAELRTLELVEEITKKGYLLAQKELALARAEIVEDIRSQIAMAKWLVGAGVAAVMGLTLLLVAVAAAVTPLTRPWLGPLVVGVVVLAVAAGLGLYGWRRRLQQPMALTRQSLKESWQWAKERVA
jgi:Putative Actinobacterial Holin-X, holin superfamily III